MNSNQKSAITNENGKSEGSLEKNKYSFEDLAKKFKDLPGVSMDATLTGIGSPVKSKYLFKGDNVKTTSLEKQANVSTVIQERGKKFMYVKDGKILGNNTSTRSLGELSWRYSLFANAINDNKHSIKVMPSEKIDNEECGVFEFKDTEGKTSKLWISTKTGVLKKSIDQDVSLKSVQTYIITNIEIKDISDSEFNVSK